MSTFKPFEATFLEKIDPEVQPILLMATDWWDARVRFAATRLWHVPVRPEDPRILVVEAPGALPELARLFRNKPAGKKKGPR